MLTYPILLCIVMVVVLAGLVFFVFRRFGEVFAGFGHAPPPLTQFLLDVGQFARTNIVLILLGAGVLAGGMIYFRTLPVAGRLWDYFVMNTIVIRNATRTLTTGRSFYLLGTMLQSGVPLLDSLRLCRSTARSYLFRNLFDQMEHDLLQGRPVSGSLESATFLPSDAAQMIATAERSGRLGQVLLTVGHYYDEEGETSVRNIVKLAEPALIVALAAVVGTVVMAVMLPLFDASTMAQ
jgi:type II secretory pathway component PulF